MTPQEESMLNDLIGRVEQTQLTEKDPEAEQLVLRANHGKRRVPTLRIGERYFACSPFNAHKLAEELKIPLNK